MAGDMVASVTLRLRDQMSVGIDQIKEQFGSVQATLDRLTGVMDRLQGTMDALRMPAQMNMALGGTVTEADAAATAVSSIGLAATANITRFTEMNAALNEWTASGGMIPRGIGPVSPVPAEVVGAPQVPRMPGDTGSSGAFEEGAAGGLASHLAGGAADYLTDAIMGAIAVDAGLKAIGTVAQFHSQIRHAAIAEHLDGAANQAQVTAVSAMLDRIALRDRQSSMEMAEAYQFLATTQMNPHLIDKLLPSIAETSTAYNTNPEQMSKAAYQLSDNFEIPASQMQIVLAQMAYAAKMAHYSVDAFGGGLSALGGNARFAHLTGQHGFDILAAALETVRKNVDLPSEATTDVNDLLSQLHSQMVNRTFDQALFKNTLKVDAPLYAKYHIAPVDLRHMENVARMHGVDPLTAVMDYIHKTVKPMTSTDEAFFVSSLFGNQQSRTAVMSLLEHWQSNHAMIKTLSGVGKDTVSTDLKTAMQGSDTQLRLLDENVAQLSRTMGTVLVPALRAVNGALSWINSGFDREAPKGMTPAEKKRYAEDPSGYLDRHEKPTPSVYSWLEGLMHGHTEAVKQNTRAVQQNSAAQAHTSTVPTAPTHAAGPVLGRP